MVSITLSEVLKASKIKAAKKYVEIRKDKDKAPLIATRDNAKDKANPQNEARLTIIGNKERIIEGVHNRVGGAITNVVLKTTHATNNKILTILRYTNY